MISKETLDKLQIISTSLIAIFTAITAFYTTNLSSRLENFKAISQEGKTVSELVNTLSDTRSTVKYDYAFLSLERYLRNINNGELKPQDKNMLVGFAQSLIYDRINTDEGVNVTHRILIPKEFLAKNDTVVLWRIKQDLNEKYQKRVPPPDNFNPNLYSVEPVAQTIDSNKSKTISLILNKVCYIQYASNDKKETALKFQKKLKDESWLAPGIEKIPGNYTNTIRYFHDEDLYLAIKVRELLGNEFTPTRIYNYEKKAPKGQIEVWVAK